MQQSAPPVQISSSYKVIPLMIKNAPVGITCQDFSAPGVGAVKIWYKIPQTAHSLETFRVPLIFLTVKALVVHLQVTAVEYQVFSIDADYQCSLGDT